MDAQLAAAVLGLSLTCIDIHLNREAERVFFWKSPIKLICSPVHCLYLLSRCLAIVAQICDIVIASIWKYKYTTIPPGICYMHLVFKTVVSHALLLILDVILMLRVFALYNKSREVASFLGITLLLKLVSGGLVLIRLKDVPPSSIYFNYICIVPLQLHQEPGVAVFVFGEMAIHGILCWLTLTKTWSLEDFWPHASALGSVLNRDALSVFVAISGTFATIIVSTYKRGLAVLFVFPIFISIISCAGCRLILHIHRLGGQDTSTDPERIIFTTINATDTWDAQIRHVRTP